MGNHHSLALRFDGTVWGWGWNWYGQLGDGTFIDQKFPVQTLGMTDVVQVVASMEFSLALKADGTVWAWGTNGYGQLGNGSIREQNVPNLVKGLTGVVQISAGSEFALALKSDGTVWAWGHNHEAQLGDGVGGDLSNNYNSNVPVQVVGLTNVVQISAGAAHSLALKGDGTLWEIGRAHV